MIKNIFSIDYQIGLCSLLVTDASFLAVNHTLIKPKYFESYHIRTIIRKIYEHFLEYRQAPTKDIMSTLINELAARENLDKDVLYVYKGYIDSVYTSEPSDQDFIRRSVVTYCKKREYIEYLEWAHEALHDNERDHEDVSNLEADGKMLNELDARFLELMSKGFSKDMGLSFKAGIARLPQMIKEEGSVKRISTGIPLLTKVMGGGYRNGGLYTWVAPPGVGKTAVLISEACHALRNGNPVVYVTFEQTEQEIFLRFVSNLMNITEKQMANRKLLSDAFRDFEMEYAPLLTIVHYNEYEATANTIMSFCRHLELIENITIRLVVVDYADYMSPLKGLSDMMYQDKGNTYKDLKKLAITMDVPCLTASQTKIDGYNINLIQMHHLEGSSMKAHIVDGMFSINPRGRPDDEIQTEAHPRVVVFIAKLRKRVGFGNNEITARLDYSKSFMYEDTWEPEF